MLPVFFSQMKRGNKKGWSNKKGGLLVFSVAPIIDAKAIIFVLKDKKLFFNYFQSAHVRTQCFRYNNAAVRLLIVFQNCSNGAANSQAGAV